MEYHEISRCPQSMSKMLLILLSLTLLRGMLYGLLIPVDQAPDELHHFYLIKARQLTLSQTFVERQGPVAAQIEMAAFALRYPESSRQPSAAEFTSASLPAPLSLSHLYYTFTAAVLNLLGLDHVRDEIYVIRGISILMGMVIVGLAFLVARELFPDKPFIAVGVPAFILFIPQFSATNGSINNDKLAEVFCALVFLLLVKILKQGLSGKYLLGLVASIILALLGKRTAAFLIPLGVLFLLVYWRRSSLGLRFHLELIGGCLGVILGGYGLLKFSSIFDHFVYDFLINHVLWVPPYKLKWFLLNPKLYSLEGLKYYAKFFIVFYWSFWGVFGYMTIHLHHFWYLLVAFLQGLSVWGLIRFAWRVHEKRERIEPWQAKSLYLFVVSLILVIAIPFVRSIVVRPGAPDLTQGRYLFPDIIPIGILTVFGLYKLVPERYDHLLSVLWIAVLLLLDSVCVFEYLCLNFHLVSLF